MIRSCLWWHPIQQSSWGATISNALGNIFTENPVTDSFTEGHQALVDDGPVRTIFREQQLQQRAVEVNQTASTTKIHNKNICTRYKLKGEYRSNLHTYTKRRYVPTYYMYVCTCVHMYVKVQVWIKRKYRSNVHMYVHTREENVQIECT